MDTYYNPEDLAKFGTIGEKAPELAEKFFSYYNAVFEEGALTAREKSLIALAVAHTVQCPYCIDAYTNDCLNKGGDRRADDRGCPCGSGNPWRCKSGSRCTDEKHRKEIRVLKIRKKYLRRQKT